MSAESLRRPAVMAAPAPLRRPAAVDAAVDEDLAPTVDARRSMPQAAVALGLASSLVVALTARPEVGPGFAYRDVVALLIAYAISLGVVARVRWTALPSSSLTAIVGLQVLFVVSLTTMTGGGDSPYFTLYAPVVALAGWHLRSAHLVTVVALVAITEGWRALVVEGDGTFHQVSIALPFFAALAAVAQHTAGRLTAAVVTIRRDQGQAADTLAAVRQLSDDPAQDPLPGLATAVSRIYGGTARLVRFDPPAAGPGALLGDSDDRRRLSVAVSGASATYGLLEIDRDRPFAASEARLIGILAGACGRALDARRLFDELRVASERDPLTGLLNRRALEVDLAGQVQPALAGGRGVAVVWIDVDGMKQVNDSRGHEAGDLVLRGVARALAASTRDSERVYRVGGDEFVVVATGVGEPEARRLAHRLLAIGRTGGRRATDPAELERVTLSIGVCVANGTGADPDALVRSADVAMYRAKSRGGDRVEVCRAPEPARAVEAVAADAPA